MMVKVIMVQNEPLPYAWTILLEYYVHDDDLFLIYSD